MKVTVQTSWMLSKIDPDASHLHLTASSIFLNKLYPNLAVN